MSEYVKQRETATPEQIKLIVMELQRWLGMPVRLAEGDGELQWIDILTPTGIPFGRFWAELYHGEWRVGTFLSNGLRPRLLPLIAEMNQQKADDERGQGGQP